ncbi:S1 family peptidase [Actinomadura madurae]|uniref:S1 family peptidase n=1 Tax=Actinomadura madurae TaxID=1993 RepID=UPI0035572CC3
MTDTDVTVYRLDTTYAAIRRRYGIPALRLSTARPADGTPIRVVSGYWRTIYGCAIDATVYRLREAGWTWKDSIRYTPRCRTIHGTSGSPVIDVRTGDVVGVNNTGNDDGGRCTFNNPCEVDRTGAVTVRHGSHYGQQTYLLARCLGAGQRRRPGRRVRPTPALTGGRCRPEEPFRRADEVTTPPAGPCGAGPGWRGAAARRASGTGRSGRRSASGSCCRRTGGAGSCAPARAARRSAGGGRGRR